MKSLLMVAGLCVLLIGCMGPTQKEYRWADFGPYPTNYHETITSWVENSFDTPRSLSISAPVRARVPKRLLNEDARIYGWCAGVSLEEKGIFDQYTPRKHFHVYLRQAEILTTSIKPPERPRTDAIVQVDAPR